MSRTLETALIFLAILAGCYFATEMVRSIFDLLRTIFPPLPPVT